MGVKESTRGDSVKEGGLDERDSSPRVEDGNKLCACAAKLLMPQDHTSEARLLPVVRRRDLEQLMEEGRKL